MILQGADGLSRGDMYEGVMRGDNMLDFIPLHLSAIERHPPPYPAARGDIAGCVPGGFLMSATETDITETPLQSVACHGLACRAGVEERSSLTPFSEVGSFV